MTSMKKLFLALALFGACAKNAPTTTAPPVTDPVPMTEEAQAPASPAAASMRTILVAYERVRVRLAADDMSGVAEAALEIQKSSNGSSESNTPDFTALANNAAMLARSSSIEAARSAFGELSRQLITMLANDKALARGLHVFECPMVSGYKKWVQPTEALENPYMGKRMLACGGESTWN
jgi:Cu(I)/Ag(I) efflux system membrane fusion protein